MVTTEAVENISDHLYLRGVDIAITHANVFDLQKSGEVRNIEQRVNYISQMHKTESYLLARGDIATMQDLAGKKVGFHVKGSGPSVTGPMVFERLGIKVEPVFISNTRGVGVGPPWRLEAARKLSPGTTTLELQHETRLAHVNEIAVGVLRQLGHQPDQRMAGSHVRLGGACGAHCGDVFPVEKPAQQQFLF